MIGQFKIYKIVIGQFEMCNKFKIYSVHYKEEYYISVSFQSDIYYHTDALLMQKEESEYPEGVTRTRKLCIKFKIKTHHSLQ